MIRVLLVLFLVAMAAFAALADDDSKDTKTAKPAKNQIVVINGKKFFPLSNARTFSGSVKPMAAVRYPRVQHLPMTHNNSVTMVPPKQEKFNPAESKDVPAISDVPAARSSPGGTGDKASSDVISVFDPEEK